MRTVQFCAVVAMALLSPTANSQPGGELIEVIPLAGNIYTPREAVDHVATIVVSETGPRRSEIVTVTRSGAKQREERAGGASVTYLDFDRHTAVSWYRSYDRENLHASQSYGDTQPARYIRQRTGEIQRWAGETCEMWSWRPANPAGYGHAASCVTHDGIELWRGDYSYDGALTEVFHAMLVERREVHPEEVRLPSSALDWQRWRAGLDAGDVKTGYDVTMGVSQSPDADAESGQLRRRQRGAWRIEEGKQSLIISHPQLHLNFLEREHQRTLTLWRIASPRTSDSSSSLVAGDTETILGHPCTWYRAQDANELLQSGQCRDVTGAVLAEYYENEGVILTTWSVRATSFSNMPPSEDTLQPPPQIFRWFAP